MMVEAQRAVPQPVSVAAPPWVSSTMSPPQLPQTLLHTRQAHPQPLEQFVPAQPRASSAAPAAALMPAAGASSPPRAGRAALGQGKAPRPAGTHQGYRNDIPSTLLGCSLARLLVLLWRGAGAVARGIITVTFTFKVSLWYWRNEKGLWQSENSVH